MNAGFLENEKYSKRIARIAIVFQSAVTLLVIYLLFRGMIGQKLFFLIYADSVFVALHLVYRKAYKGKRILLPQQARLFLVLHSIFALLSIGLTFMLYAIRDMDTRPYAYVTLGAWIVTLALGFIFYYKKYQPFRVLG